MPIVDGKEAIQAIRLQSKEVPIIAMTANCSEEFNTELIELGANGFLTKPFGRHLLLETAAMYAI